MHDPGCHWFAAGSALKTTLSVKGPVKLRNLDEAALKVAGAKGRSSTGSARSSSSHAACTTSRWSGRHLTTTT